MVLRGRDSAPAAALSGSLFLKPPALPEDTYFGHDQNKLDELQRRYVAEPDKQVGAWEPILKAAQNCAVTLIYSSHDTEHNNAVALKEYLEARMRKDAHKRSWFRRLKTSCETSNEVERRKR